jgi:hypothetical protein
VGAQVETYLLQVVQAKGGYEHILAEGEFRLE